MLYNINKSKRITSWIAKCQAIKISHAQIPAAIRV